MESPVDQNIHDLFSFVQSVTDGLANEYDRIQRRLQQDPGTAGDQGEENWAAIMREWLPPSYHVVTKGRLLSDSGLAGPQVDVLVLRPSYPQYLRDKKVYLAAGVAAAFECKLTLRAHHISEAVEHAGEIKRLLANRKGSPYKELVSPLVYGILAHSHEWKAPASKPANNISLGLQRADHELTKHPREALDVACVSDVGTFTQAVSITDQGNSIAPGSAFLSHSSLAAHELGVDPKPPAIDSHVRPVGTLLVYLLRRLAWEDPSIRDIAEYFHQTGLGGAGLGMARIWPTVVFSESTRLQLAANQLTWGGLPTHTTWNEWGRVFP
jgi:hypothetical protein